MDSAPAPAPSPLPARPLPAAAPPLVLQYDTGRPRRRVVDLALFLPANVAAAVAAYLPFTWGIAPVEVVLNTGQVFTPGTSAPEVIILLLAWGFFVPVVLLPYRLRLLLTGIVSRPERRVAYAVAALAAAAVASCLALMGATASSREEYFMTAVGAASLAAGGAIFWRVARRAGDLVRPALAALLVPYVANSSVVLFGFADNPDPGWYVTLAAAGAGLAELVLLAATSRKF